MAGRVSTSHKFAEVEINKFFINEEPFYRPVGDEVELFETAHLERLPVSLKGPTGCGKTRFLTYIAYKLGRPLITIACHEDLTASDLVGRYLLDGETTRWFDGPLTLAVRNGAICYLDEVVEARKDTTVVIHPLTDDRRILPIEKKGQVLQAPDEFQMVISYNPGYQSILKDLKQSTKQRFITLEFDYPPTKTEIEIVVHESGVSPELSEKLVKAGQKIRNLKDRGLDEGVSTRLLIYAGQLISNGVDMKRACHVAMVDPLTDDPIMKKTLYEIVASII